MFLQEILQLFPNVTFAALVMDAAVTGGMTLILSSVNEPLPLMEPTEQFGMEPEKETLTVLVPSEPCRTVVLPEHTVTEPLFGTVKPPELDPARLPSI